MMSLRSHLKSKRIITHQLWSPLAARTRALEESYGIFLACLQNRSRIQMFCVLDIKISIPINYLKVFCILAAFNQALWLGYRIMGTRSALPLSTARFCTTKATLPTHSSFADVSALRQKESTARTHRLRTMSLWWVGGPGAMVWLLR